MLNGDDNENGFKTNRSNQQKNKLHVQHTFSSNQQKTNLQVQHAFLSFPSRCFARLQRCFIPVRACLHEGGGPQIGVLTCGGSPHLSCQRDQIKMRDHVDRRVIHQSGLRYQPGVPYPPCKQARKRQTSQLHIIFIEELSYMCVPNILFRVIMFAFIFHCRLFSPCWPLAFLIFSPPLCLPTKFVSFVFNNSLQLFLCYPRQCKHKK